MEARSLYASGPWSIHFMCSYVASMLIYTEIFVYRHGLWPLYSACRSNGTLLPLPALYFFGTPWKSLGLGIRLSSLKCHLESLTVNLAPELGEGESDGLRLRLGEPAPFADKVYELGSNMDCRREDPRLLE
jgi:hypothetical protein